MARTFFPLFQAPMRDKIADGDGLPPGSGGWERWYEKIRELLHRHDVFEVSIVPVSVAANTVAEQAFTVTGVRGDMAINVTPPSITAGVGLSSARVSANDTAQVAFVNPTGGALTPPSGVYKFKTTRP